MHGAGAERYLRLQAHDWPQGPHVVPTGVHGVTEQVAQGVGDTDAHEPRVMATHEAW